MKEPGEASSSERDVENRRCAMKDSAAQGPNDGKGSAFVDIADYLRDAKSMRMNATDQCYRAPLHRLFKHRRRCAHHQRTQAVRDAGFRASLKNWGGVRLGRGEGHRQGCHQAEGLQSWSMAQACLRELGLGDFLGGDAKLDFEGEIREGGAYPKRVRSTDCPRCSGTGARSQSRLASGSAVPVRQKAARK